MVFQLLVGSGLGEATERKGLLFFWLFLFVLCVYQSVMKACSLEHRPAHFVKRWLTPDAGIGDSELSKQNISGE